jgi:hypothetical protein
MWGNPTPRFIETIQVLARKKATGLGWPSRCLWCLLRLVDFDPVDFNLYGRIAE